MKAAFCIPKGDLDTTRDTLFRLAELGYDAVELWKQTIEAHGPEVLSQWTAEAGIEVVQVCPYFDFTTSEASAAESLERAAKYIRIAKALRCPRVRVFTNPMHAFPSGMEADDACWRRAAAALKDACRLAAPERIELTLECHHGDGQLCDSTPAVRRMLEAVDEPNLGVNLQPPLLEETPLESARNLASFVTHLHAHNWIGGWEHRTFLDSGDVDFEGFVHILRRQGGFDGAISIEHPNHHPLWEIAEHEIRYLKSLIARLTR